MGTEVKPAEIARKGLIEAKKKNVDVVIMDTAGRLQVCHYVLYSWDGQNNISLLFTGNIYLFKVSMLSSSLYQIDKDMMDELKEVKRELNPTEVLLVVDAMTGQEAAGSCSSYLI